MSLTVGQTLFAVYSRRNTTPQEVTVLKVGRKWAELSDRYRIDVNTLYMDGGQYASPGRCYINREAYEAEAARNTAWGEVRRFVDRCWNAPDHLSTDDITTILAKFKGPLE